MLQADLYTNLQYKEDFTIYNICVSYTGKAHLELNYPTYGLYNALQYSLSL
jgi:hypothetical protein